MDVNKIRELLKVVAESGVAEVEIEEDGFKLVARKSASSVVMQTAPMFPAYGMGFVPPPYAPPPAPIPSVAPNAPSLPPPAPVPSMPTPPVAPAGQNAEETGTTVRAPIVGTFYRAPAPDSDPFVQVGSQVNPGDVLCIIEAMKLMNEIECEVTGTVKKILVENAEAVEYDQPLFIIEEA